MAKWLPGQVTIPLPSSGNINTWSANSYYTSRPQVEARINFGTTPTIVSSTGIQTITASSVANTATGQFTITFPTVVANANYGALITARGTTPYILTYNSVTTTGFVIHVFSTAGSLVTPTTNDFTIRTTI